MQKKTGGSKERPLQYVPCSCIYSHPSEVLLSTIAAARDKRENISLQNSTGLTEAYVHM
jgi:hypothetical protein